MIGGSGLFCLHCLVSKSGVELEGSVAVIYQIYGRCYLLCVPVLYTFLVLTPLGLFAPDWSVWLVVVVLGWVLWCFVLACGVHLVVICGIFVGCRWRGVGWWRVRHGSG